MLKKLVCLGIVGVMLLSAFVLVWYTNEKTEPRQIIKEITEIEVPNGSKILYHYIEQVFVNERCDQYTVFEFESEPANWLKENSFLDGRDSENENYFENCSGFSAIKIEDIPNEYIPNFENTHLWLRTQNAYFFYYPQKLMLMVLIAGS